MKIYQEPKRWRLFIQRRKRRRAVVASGSGIKTVSGDDLTKVDGGKILPVGG